MNGEESGKFTIKDRRSGWLEPKISVGNLLTVLAMLVAVLMAWNQLDKQQEVLRTRFDLYIQTNDKQLQIKDDLEKLKQMIRDLDSKMESRTQDLRKRIG